MLQRLIDSCIMQGFLAEGLQRTTAGLGSIIIDSQPLTVALLAAVLFRERLTAARYAGLGLGVLGLSLLAIPAGALANLPEGPRYCLEALLSMVYSQSVNSCGQQLGCCCSLLSFKAVFAS